MVIYEICIKYGKLTSYTLQLVETEFEIMSSDQANKKFAFTEMTPPSNLSSFGGLSYKSRELSLEKYNKSKSSHGCGSSSSSFQIPLEDLRLENTFIEAYMAFNHAKTEIETTAARIKIDLAKSIAENQAILEISLDNCLLDENVEILVKSKYMPETIFETLIQDVIPIFLYGITTNHLNEEVTQQK